ncbi:MAG: NERD domain-containing protein [Clostridia bacterium]|nr:NERD domain-containing protein [Clostridia bacterium]
MIWFMLGIIAVIIFIAVLISSTDLSAYQHASRRTGRRGEVLATEIIRQALYEGDHLFTNVSIEYDGRPAELDNVIVNRYGVFIIEVKNYKGLIVGAEDDYEWRKYKTTSAGNVYEKTVKNPIKQVKRQTYILAHYLEENGARVWIRGYAMLLYGNSPVESEYVLNGREDAERVIHTKDREILDAETVDRIVAVLSSD